MNFGFHNSTIYATNRDRRYQRLEWKKTDQGIINQSVRNSLALTQGCSSLLTENGLHPLHYSWMNSICDIAVIRQHQQRTTKCRYLY